MMKYWAVKYILIPLLLIFSVPAVAQGPYFCDAQGTVLRYERRYSDSGDLKWRHAMTIISVEPEASGASHVKYQSSFTKPNGSAMYGGPVALQADILADGTVMLDLSESMASVFRNLVPGAAKVSATGGSTSIPGTVKPGDALPDASCVVTVAGMKYTTSVTEREVIGEEDLQTPAGRFHCLVISEHKVEKGPGRNRVTTAHTWYSAGVGMVRHDTYDRNMKLETSELLVSVGL